MIDLTQHQELIVRQRVELLEAFTGFETENRYEILTPDGQSLLYAYEESGGLARLFLKTHRPLDIHVIDQDRNLVLSASRDFFWFLSHLHVSDASGNHIGTLNRRFAVLKRRLTLTDSNDRPFGQILGSLFRHYTFVVENSNGREIGPGHQAVVGSASRGVHRRRHVPGPIQRCRAVPRVSTPAACVRIRDRSGLLRAVDTEVRRMAHPRLASTHSHRMRARGPSSGSVGSRTRRHAWVYDPIT